MFFVTSQHETTLYNTISCITNFVIDIFNFLFMEHVTTSITNEDISNGINDEYSILYSRDGKRLLKCKNNNISNYKVKDGTEIICDGAFDECVSLLSIIIPDSVTFIGNNVFSYCVNLKSINISDKVNYIGNGAFEYCVGLEKIKLPSSLKSISDGLFLHCRFLKNVEIPNSVSSIGKKAFACCYNLGEIKIPEGVTSIGDYVFSWCSSLYSVSISKTVTRIGKGIFGKCSSLKKIIIDSQNEYYDSRGNCNAIIECNENVLIAGCATTVIPTSVLCIDRKAFYRCDFITQISIPENIISIRGEAFYQCSNLKSINVPKNLKYLASNAFDGSGPFKLKIYSECYTNFQDLFDSLSKGGYEIEII